MRYLKRYKKLFESITQQERSRIQSVCQKYGITNYTINDDGSIDVNVDVDLRNKQLTKLPLKFGFVSGDFYCYNNKLTTLEGCPREVGGDFDCDDNQLTTLEGGPREVGGSFNCSRNKLTTLEGCPRQVGGYFDCSCNKVHKIYSLFTDYKSFLLSLDYNYFKGGNEINELALEDALSEIGKELPNSIEGYEYI